MILGLHRRQSRPAVEVIRSPDAFASMAGEWDSLAASLGDRALFSSHGWISRAWQRHAVQRGRSMHILAVREHGRLVLGAPLVEIAGWLGVSTLAPLDSMTPQYNDILFAGDCDRDSLHEVFLSWLRRHPRIRALKLTGVRGDSGSAAMLHAAGARVTWSTVAQTVDLTAHADSDAFFASRSAKTRYRFRHQLRLLARNGHVRFRRIGAGPQLAMAIRWIFEHKAKWVKKRFPDTRNWLTAPGTAEFFGDVAAREAASGGASINALELDGQPVAAVLAFHRGRTTFASKLAYDPAWKDVSPGWLVMMNLIMESCGQTAYVDLMLGQDAWKDHFGGTAVSVANYRLGNFPFLGS